jgi:hypothetical protein
MRELTEYCGVRGFRFPLQLDPEATLSDHLSASGWAPASSRFGAYCDNVIGMNWELPGGRVVRLGERVVKSTTGYDLFRFLLHTDGRYGRAIDYVLRLRPDCGGNACYRLRGELRSVQGAGAALLSTCWLHWFDAVDAVPMTGSAEVGGDLWELRIQWHGPESEQSVCSSWIENLAQRHNLMLLQELEQTRGAGAFGLPDFVVKSVPGKLEAIIDRLRAIGSWKLTALLYPGVVLGAFAEPSDVGAATESMRTLRGELEPLLSATGGDVQSRHLRRESASAQEAGWLQVFAEEIAGQ